MSAAKLYTSELLALTIELAGWPAIENLAFHGEARSTTCGSTIRLDLGCDSSGAIDQLGMRVRACAIGQAAAAIFARHAKGRDQRAITAASSQIVSWLAGDGPLPEWPDLSMLEQARGYPARHGAILLPWRAAVEALSSAPATS